MVSDNREVAAELLPAIRVYKDGTVERLLNSPFVPSSPGDPTTGVSAKDITISPEVSARLYLPKLSGTGHGKLPILVYFHGGGFCIESAFSFLSHRYINSLVSEARVLAISVEYRLAPENPLPAAYEDSWAALQWVASNSVEQNATKLSEPWLVNYGDFDRVYVGGDSSGANIAHYIAMRAGTENFHVGTRMKILGAFLSQPFFWGSKPLGSEPVEDREKTLSYRTWMFVYPSAIGGIDNPMTNPLSSSAPRLSGLSCSRLLVCVAGEDELRERGIRYGESVRESGWMGELELYVEEGEGHCFHILCPETDAAKKMIKRLASFLKREWILAGRSSGEIHTSMFPQSQEKDSKQ